MKTIIAALLISLTAACGAEDRTTTNSMSPEEATQLVSYTYCGIKVGCDPRFAGWASCMSVALFTLSGEGAATVSEEVVDACEEALVSQDECTASLPEACSMFVRHDW